jgi:arsenate reductase
MRTLRVLFVCIGNAYRSQMAEGLARRLGSDVLVAESAGLSPTMTVPEVVVRLMKEKGIDISSQFPKAVASLDVRSYDLVVNMTGLNINSLPSSSSRTWEVGDPVGQKDDVVRATRDKIEALVMGLILELRGMREEWEKPKLRSKLRGV